MEFEQKHQHQYNFIHSWSKRYKIPSALILSAQ